jgi:phosphoribosylglycinamide formyltransferase-1
MMHLVTRDLDEGPPITFVTFPIQGHDFDGRWKDVDEKLKHHSFQQLVKEEGENNPLFKEIRRQGVRRELPLIVMTLKSLSENRVRIERGRVLDDKGKEVGGICLNDEVEEYLKQSHS